MYVWSCNTSNPNHIFIYLGMLYVYFIISIIFLMKWQVVDAETVTR